jgi:Protein of unknown function (DUF1579)
MRRTPAPELQKLNFFVGDWKSEAIVHGAAGSVGKKYTSASHAEWMEGGFFLIENWHWKIDGDTAKELSIKGYDSAHNVYTYHAFTSHGDVFYDTGTVDGGIWTWIRQQGSGAVGRYTITMTLPASYSFQFDSSEDGANWTTIMEGTALKL